MAGRHCAVFGCSNGDYHLQRWMKNVCQTHGVHYGCCVCCPPFDLFTFPRQDEHRRRWIKLVSDKYYIISQWLQYRPDGIAANDAIPNPNNISNPNPNRNAIMNSSNTQTQTARPETDLYRVTDEIA